MQPVDLKYQIAIEMIPMVGSITAKKLIAFCGGAEAVFRESKSALRKIQGIGERIANAVTEQQVLELAEKELEYIEKNNIRALSYTDNNYPHRLKNCEDSPVVLFVKGDINLNAERILSIVGTRSATSYGVDQCTRLVEELAQRGHNPVIASGLAYGIDICAHKAALKYGLPTVAVVATGLNTVYPAQHKNVAKQIVEQGGAMVSDFTTHAKFDRNNFLRRNRIIAGLADATIVVESGEKGGALVTADISMSYNRDVMAFPGRVGDAYSCGCNRLIRNNKAALIEGVADVEYVLGWDKRVEPKVKQLPLFGERSEPEKKVLDALSKVEVETIDNLCRQLDMPVSQLASVLLTLEFSGCVRSHPGKAYSLCRG